MDQLVDGIAKVQGSLHESRRTLQNLEKNAQKSISSEVDDYRKMLKQGDARIEHVVFQLQTFLNRIEYHEKAETIVDVTPQMEWLVTSLQNIVQELDAARNQADSAIQCTEGYTYNVLDITHEVEVKNTTLTKLRDQATLLSSNAQRDLTLSEAVLKDTEADIECKEQDIEVAAAELRDQRNQKAELESNIRRKNSEIQSLQRRRRESKKDAKVGAGLALLGIGLAPFTGGMSLGLAMVGGGVTGYNIGSAQDLKEEVQASERSLSSFNWEITQNAAAITRLEDEKNELLERVEEHKSEIARRRSTHVSYNDQIRNANKASDDIGTLKNYAVSIQANVTEALPELQKIKLSLEACTTLLKEKSLDVSTSTSFAERWVGRIPLAVARETKKSMNFRKQKKLLVQVTATLDGIHAQVPSLLPSSTTKFLDIKPWNAGAISVAEVFTRIPDMAFH